MANVPHEVELGLSVDGNLYLLNGITTELGNTFTNNAPLTSIFGDSTDNKIKVKTETNNVAGDWKAIATEDYVNSVATSVVSSWRDPVVANDKLSTVLPTGTGGNTITVDGVTVDDDDRVLFSSITGGDGKNVYIYNKTLGTFANDSSNVQTSGDAVYVVGGTHGGHVYLYNGSDWIQIGQDSLTEEEFIRTFIGKASIGGTMPQYSSNNAVTDTTDDLVSAIGTLDGALGDGDFTTTTGFILNSDATWNSGTLNLTSALELLNTEIGNRTYTSGLVLTDDAELTQSFDELNVAIGNRTYTAGNVILDGETVSVSLGKLSDAIGDRTYTSTTHVNSGESITDSINSLDAAVTAAAAPIRNSLANQAITTLTEIVSAGDVDSAKFIVTVRETTTQGNMTSCEIHAMTDGTNTDQTVYAKLKLGGGVVNLQFSAVYSGSELRLQARADNNVDVVAQVVVAESF